MSLFNELKRRNVLRVGAAYVVAAWLVIQVVETILPAFGFGDVAVRTVTIAFAIGLVPALILSWAFELTPDGLQKETDVDRNLPASSRAGKRLDRLIMVGLALALGYFAFDKFVLDPGRDAQLAKAAAEAGAEQALEKVRQDMWNEKSIAVLPFINRSELKEDEYFTDGMHDELLTRLALIEPLKVISRTSVMRYRNTDKSLPEIARELSVATVLEGGVQRVGQQVRINVQLINAHTDEHLWADIYDRELTTQNLFAIQSDISKAIADALQAELTPSTLSVIESIPTHSAEAYDLYLQAIRERNSHSGWDAYEPMKPILERAVALDPDFLRAQVLLAEIYGRLIWAGADPEHKYATKALELVTDIRRRWPDRPEGHLALGHFHYTVERDYASALAEFQLVEKVFPNDEEVLRALGASLKRLGRIDDALVYSRRQVELDPENSLAASELMLLLALDGAAEEVLAAAEEGFRKFPEEPLWSYDLARYRLIFLGDTNGYLAYGKRLREMNDWALGGRNLTWLLFGSGDADIAIEHIAARMHGEYGWTKLPAEIDAVLILRAQGRDTEAQAAADHALDFVRSWIDSEQPFPRPMVRHYYAIAAYAAAAAGDLEAVESFLAASRAAPRDERIHERLTTWLYAETDALLDRADTGWTRIETYQDEYDYQLFTPEYAAVQPYYQLLFGDVPAFQEYVAKAEIEE